MNGRPRDVDIYIVKGVLHSFCSTPFVRFTKELEPIAAKGLNQHTSSTAGCVEAWLSVNRGLVDSISALC